MKRTLLSLLFCAAIPLTLGAAEWPVSTPRIDLTPYTKSAPAVVFNGSEYLVAWNESAVMARRVTATGEAIDPLPFILPINWSGPFAVTWNGSEYVFVWNDLGLGSLRAARIARDGRLIEQKDIASYPRVSAYDVPVIATNGSSIVIGYSDGQRLVALVTDNQLNVRTTIPLISSAGGFPVGSIAVSSDGHRFLLLWRISWIAPWGIDGMVLDPDGGSVPLSFGTNTTTNFAPQVVFDGSRWVVAFGVSASYTAVRLTTVGSDGSIAGSDALVPKPADATFYGSSQAVSIVRSSGGAIAVLWPAYSGPFVEQRLASDLTFASTFTLSSQQPTAFAVSSDGALLAMTVGTEVRALPIRSDGSAGTATSLAIGATYQEQPLIDPDPQGFLTAWFEIEPSRAGRGLYTGRLAADGRLLSGEGKRLGNAFDHAPAVAFNGTSHLLAWWDGTWQNARLMVCRIGMNGEPLETPRVVQDSIRGSVEGPPAVATDGAGWMLVWSFAGGGLRAQRVHADGSFDPEIVVTEDTPHRTRPSVAFGGGMYWVVWEQRNLVPLSCPFECPIATQGDIYFARITPAGQMLDPVNGLPVAVNAEDNWMAVVAAGEKDAVVVWGSVPFFGTSVTIRAATIANDGQLVDVTPSQNGRVVAEPGNWYGVALPTLSISGDGEHNRLVFDILTVYGTHEIHSTVVEPNAAPNDTVLLRTGGSVYPVAAITPGSLRSLNGRWYVAWLRIAADPSLGLATRAFVTTIDDAPQRRRAVR